MRFIDRFCPDDRSHTDNAKAKPTARHKFCPVCGRPLQVAARCSHYESAMYKEAYCRACGEKLSEELKSRVT